MSDSTATPGPTPARLLQNKSRRRAVRWPIHVRLTLFVGFVVVFTAEVLSFAGYWYARKLMLSKIHDELSVVASDRQGRLLDYIRHQQDRLRLISSRTRLRQLLEERAVGQLTEEIFRTESQRILSDVERNVAGYSAVFIADNSGKVIATTDESLLGKDMSSDPDFVEGQRQPHFGLPRAVEGRGYESTLSGPIRTAGGRPLGVMLVLVDVRTMVGFLADTTGLGETGEALIGIPQGDRVRFLFPPRRSRTTYEVALANVPALASAINGQKGFELAEDFTGTRVLAAYRPVGYERWGIVTKIDEAEAYEPIKQLRQVLFGLGFAILLIGLAIAYLAARRFSQPILELASAAEAVTAGDLQARVVVRSSNELGLLGETFNQMTAQLAESYETLEHRVEDRTHDLALSEQALRQQTGILQSILDSMGDGVVVADDQGKFIVFNRAAERIIGLGVTDAPPAEWVRLYGIFRPDGVTPVSASEVPLARAIRGETTDQVELFVRNEKVPGGVFISVTGGPLRDESGALKGGVVVFRDISEYKRAEQTLRDSEALYHSLVESLPLNVYRKDLQSRFTFGNQKFVRAIGHAPEQFIGKTDYDFYPKELADKYRRDDLRVIEKGEIFEDIEEHRDPGGEMTYVHVLKTRVFDARGEVIGTQGMFWDITAQKHTEDMLARERDLLHTLMDNIPDTIYFKDLDSQFTRINKAQELVLGVADPYEAIGKTDFDFFPAEQARESFDDEQKILQTGQALIGKAEKVQRADGYSHWVSTTKVPIRGKDGRISGLFGISRDITDLEQARMALEKSADELKRSNAELEQFAYVASHDLQEPLRMVASYLQLLDRRYRDRLDDDAREFIDYAVDGAARMRTLISDLLAYSRVGTHGQPFERIDCEKLLTRVLANLLVALDESNATITHDELPKLVGDPVQIEQLLQNLVANAVKFRKKNESPTVHLSASRAGNQWIFSVRDNGIGIDAEHRDRIFVIFQRLHSWTEYPGTGIGLAICKRIVERHGGRMWIESQPGKGSTFFFTIPVREETKA